MAHRILIVDDAEDIRLYLRTVLQKAGYPAILCAANGKEALNILETQEVDLILLDVEMDGMDGIQTCQAIRTRKGLLDVPIIMVTAREDLKTLKKAFQAGALDYVRKPFRKGELLARVRSALRLKTEMDLRKQREAELEALTRKLEEANEKLRRLSEVDGLTGLANRRVLDQVLLREVSRAHRYHRPLSLLMLDVDRFKAYNDTYGHLAGDACLQQVARVLQRHLKRPADLAARYGGEEFVGVLPETPPEGAITLAERILQGVRALNIPHAALPWGVVTVSIGVASYTERIPSSPERWIQVADQALYQAKVQGRNQVVALVNPPVPQQGGPHGKEDHCARGC